MPRSTRRLLAGIAVALLAGGCGDGVTGPTSQRGALDAARAKWNATSFTSYDFTLRTVCFCAVTDPVRVSVDANAVTSAITETDHRAIDPRFVQTINSLFTFVDNAITNHAAVLEVTYDPTFGFPTRIVYDGSAMTADDETTITVSNFGPPGTRQ